jgi:hypothetical protein
MSKKSQIFSLLDEGKDYDEIQRTVEGATRAYIRTVAGEHQKVAANAEIQEEVAESKAKSEIEDESGGMEFDNDLDNNGGNMTNENNDPGKDKTGAQHHKEWVSAKGYECECGCTLNRKSTFCPHCGVSLDWGGF